MAGVAGSIAATTATGNPPKAVICVPNAEKIKTYKNEHLRQALEAKQREALSRNEVMSEKAIQSFLNEESAKADAALENLSRTTSGLLQNDVLSNAQSQLNSYRSLTDSSAAASGGVDLAAARSNMNYFALEVQYNPSSLRLSSSGGITKTFTSGMGDGAENQIKQTDCRTKTDLTCQLIFSSINSWDAFMTENLAPTVGNAVSGVSDLINRNRGEGYSVQTQVEGFLAALTRGYTRQILFIWSKMCFRGELVSVDVQYKMFNKKGNPILAAVNIDICQQPDAFSENMWYRSFDRVFKEVTEI